MRHTSLSLRDSRRLSGSIARWLICGLLLAVTPQMAQAQGRIDKRLVLSVAPEFDVVRGHAPLSLSVTLSWLAAPLMEGRLQLDWYVEQTLLGRYVAPDLALSDSTLQFDVMLPPVILPVDDAIFSVQGKFFASDGTVYDLDVHDVALQPDWRRILLVAVCTTPGPAVGGIPLPQPTAPTNSLAQRFRLEPFFESRFTKRELLVDNTEVDPQDVPTDPLKLTAFDLFVVPGESLARLRPRQLDALLAWVRAGGSLCVLVDSAVPPSHVAWLNQLVGRDLTDAAFVRGTDGDVVPLEETFRGLSRHHRDYGRVVTVVGDAELSEEQWKQAVLFLWKVRADRRRLAEQNRLWSLNPPELGSDFVLPSPLEPQRFWQKNELANLLLPDSVRGLPLTKVSVVLALFLLIIAPGDYLLLGWLKRRRWTWVLFPCVSLLFTGYTMWLARQHLGQTSYEHVITVVDLGEDGRPVRTSRFEMLYAASNRVVHTDLEQELMAPLDPIVDRLVRPMQEPRAPREYEQPWIFSGRVPQKYSVQRDVQQWSPRMARITTFGGDQAPPSSTADPAADTVRSDKLVLRSAPDVPAQIVTLAELMTARPAGGFFSVVSQLSPTCGGNWEDLTLLDTSSDDQRVLVEITNPSAGQYVIIRRLQRESN